LEESGEAKDFKSKLFFYPNRVANQFLNKATKPLNCSEKARQQIKGSKTDVE